MTRWGLLAVSVWLLLLALPAGAGELRITVKGISSSNGAILIGLYDSAESFDRAIALSDKEGFLNDPVRVAGGALAKNDEKYMPPEVAAALKKSGHWQETAGQKVVQ